MNNLIPDIDINEVYIKTFFKNIINEIHDICLNDDNDDKIDSQIYLLHNLIIIEKQINNSIKNIRNEIFRISNFIDEAKNLENTQT